jgi:hypothetical protein
MKYATEMASCGVIYMQSFSKIVSDIQKLIVGMYTYIQTALRSHKPF